MGTPTANRGFSKVPTNSPDYEATGPWVGNNAALDALDAALGVEVDAASGAIAIKEGTVLITKGSAAAMTLAAPTAGLPSAGTPGDDGKVLRIVGTTAFAHTVTAPANKINGTKHLFTFANAGDSCILVAYNGVWYSVATPTAVLT